ncbi:hypothetical protein BC939DRAFT_495550, partial [Gamsiella multidivaricata]|uniref:uncharacterized protein n=1 Tax=Gamsiella multidivaricata TaxID=101098 RepID=UPI00221FDBD4
MEDTNASCSGLEAQLPLDLTLSRAAAAFRDADFFESCALFWSAGLDHITSSTSPGTKIEEEEDSLTILISALDLEQELGLDVQAEEPIDLVFPATTATEVKKSPDSSVFVDAETISPIHNYVLTALCYLARHINVRMDILPSGQDTLTSLGPPQRYYISLTDVQKQTYHAMLAVVLATASSIAKR